MQFNSAPKSNRAVVWMPSSLIISVVYLGTWLSFLEECLFLDFYLREEFS